MSRSHEVSVTRHAPLNTAAAANQRKSCASIHNRAGIVQLTQSKMAVQTRRPSLSVNTPLSSAQNIWDTRKMVEMRPIWLGLRPSAAI